MKTDRELTELAAKAAVITIQWMGGSATQLHPDGFFTGFSPLNDDGDALRLAVQCGIEVSFVDDYPGRDGQDSRACAGYFIDGDARMKYVFEDNRGDILAATRRAITRAAAEIGSHQS